jgi:hypothetical protein
VTTTTPLPLLTQITPGLGDIATLRALQADIAAALPTQDPQTQQAAPSSALQTAVQAAVVNQGGLATLFADLNAALHSTHMPAAVQAAIAQVLGFQLPIDPPPSAAQWRRALAQSGLLMEAQLAAPDAATGDDLKTALLTLSQALQTWAGAAVTRPSTTSPPPAPPRRGGPVQGQPATASGLPADASAETIAGRLMRQASAALSRQVLMQAASASGGGGKAVDKTSPAHWLFEIPLATPRGAAVAQFEIDRDGSTAGASDAQPIWRARFSLDIDPIGPVHAEISLSGGKARVALWAANSETVDDLTARRDDLTQALRADALESTVAVFPGAPKVAPPPAGQFTSQAI